ncbi:unnamed protein product [Discosporangium mesarthrocarpum]
MDTGQITVAVGKAKLFFKSSPTCEQELFVKFSFDGLAGSIFLPADQEDRSATLRSQAAVIPPVSSPQGEDETAGGWTPTASTVDIGFRHTSSNFELSQGELSKLTSSLVTVEVWTLLPGDDAGETLVGSTSIDLMNVLQGVNEWSGTLPLGRYDPPASFSRIGEGQSTDEGRSKEGSIEGQRDAEAGRPSTGDGNGRGGGNELTDVAESHDSIGIGNSASVATDESPGLLQFGGSTSTIHVTLQTDDDTADYTVGGGLLWTDGARVTCLPEEWKMTPSPETDHAVWHQSIADKLAAPPKHEYTLSWPGDQESQGPGQDAGFVFPHMKLLGGVLSYAPDEDTDTDEGVGGSSIASAVKSTATGDQPLGHTDPGPGGEDNEDAPPLPLPPSGSWSVRFPGGRAGGVFLHRHDIRALRQALQATRNGAQTATNQEVGEGEATNKGHGDGEGSCRGDESGGRANLLPVLLERVPCAPLPVEVEPKAKKGKKGADKAAPEPEAPPEQPWACVAWVDLSMLLGGGKEGEDGPKDVHFEVPLTLKLGPCPKEHKGIPKEEGEVLEDEVGGGEADCFCFVAFEHTCGIGQPLSYRIPTLISNLHSQFHQYTMADAGTFLDFSLCLSRPLLKAPVVQEKGMRVQEIFTPKEVGPRRKPPRDVDLELKEEMDAFIVAMLGEYAKLFLQPGSEVTAQHRTVEDRQKRLFYALNTTGVYHAFRERLKPRVQRVVRKRFGAAPSPEGNEADEFVASLYTHLVEQATIVLNERIRNIEAKATPAYLPTNEDKTLEEKVLTLGTLALDAEAWGDKPAAIARHEDRIEAASAAAGCKHEWKQLLEEAWEDYAYFSLRNSSMDRGALCLQESLALAIPDSKDYLGKVLLLAAISLESGQLEKARALLEEARDKRLPPLEPGAEGYDTDQLSMLVPPRVNTLLCLLRDAMGDAQGARRSLHLGVVALRKEGVTEEKTGAGQGGGKTTQMTGMRGAREPRRTAVLLMHSLCEWLLSVKLVGVARRAFAVAEESERVTIKKAQERGLSTRTPTVLRESVRRLKCLLIVAEGGALKDAEALAQEATELLPDDPRPWQALAEALDAQGTTRASDAVGAWGTVLNKLESMWRSGSGPVPPLRVYMRVGVLCNTLGRADEAKSAFLRACRVWSAPGPWLGCGIACLRLEQWEEAEDALQQASRLDCNNPLIWGHLALLLLSLGEDRLEEGVKVLSQALRLGLKDAPLLRELGNCYVAIDRLEAAEETLRLSLVSDSNPHTRRRLADVLSARNCVNQAVEEYRQVFLSPSVEEDERKEALSRCSNLLHKMGRWDEAEELLAGGAVGAVAMETTTAPFSAV